MRIINASFLKSSAELEQCPIADRPEYAFIGRSNVGKSSLINMLCDRNKLAKISGRPGKTQLINHFDIDEKWYLVDLPGYGFAKVPKTERAKWKKFTWDYLENRGNLMCVFVLVDGRIDPQPVDIAFMNELGDKGIPFQIVFTKMEKVKAKEKSDHFEAFSAALLKTWEKVPTYFHSSAVSKEGQVEILQFIKKTNPLYDPDGQL